MLTSLQGDVDIIHKGYAAGLEANFQRPELLYSDWRYTPHTASQPDDSDFSRNDNFCGIQASGLIWELKLRAGGERQCVVLSLPSLWRGEHKTSTADAAVSDYQVGKGIDKVCYDFRLSKSALAEILGVSRQTIYDWQAGRNQSIRPDNFNRITWLSELSSKLAPDLKRHIWAFKDRHLSGNETIKDVLMSNKSVDVVAKKIGEYLPKWLALVQLNSANSDLPIGDLVEKSDPFSNEL